jgi:hypothetical protein
MNTKTKPLVYLAVPYTHADPLVREERFRIVSQCAGWLLSNADVWVYSPITHGHPINEYSKGRADKFEWKHWAELAEHMIGLCNEFWILMLPGWEQSVGVTAEKNIAERLGLRIRYITMSQASIKVLN